MIEQCEERPRVVSWAEEFSAEVMMGSDMYTALAKSYERSNFSQMKATKGDVLGLL